MGYSRYTTKERRRDFLIAHRLPLRIGPLVLVDAGTIKGYRVAYWYLLRRETEALRKEEKARDEAFRLYRISMIGREASEGISVIALRFEPRAEYKPKTQEGKILSKVRGSAWFSEDDKELVRIEAELLDNLSLGLGFVVRFNKGMRLVFQRRRVNGPAMEKIDE